MPLLFTEMMFGDVNTISIPTDAICIISLLIIFIILYYRASGLLAAIALILNLIMVVAVLAGLNATLTLPGIAGIVLTVGMAVDANILIFERIKEELRVGRTLQFAVHIGFNRAWTSIRDGNVSTILIALVLFFFGSGSANSAITGFSIALLIGVMTSMFTAIFISRKLLGIVGGTFLRRFPQLFSPESLSNNNSGGQR